MMKFVTEDQIKNIKAHLEAEYCAKLSKTTLTNHSSGATHIKLFCKLNADRSTKCPFLVQFIEHGMGFIMKETNLNHMLECTLNNEQAFFAKNKLVLDSHREDMIKIMRAKPDSRPREILDTLIQNLGLDPNFLTQGLQGDKHFERRMKKKFDNTILELRNQMNIVCPKDKNKKPSKTRVARFSKEKPVKKVAFIPRNSPSMNHHHIFSNYQQPIQIVNNLQYFISHPVVELINDQDRGTMKIHLVNKSKDKMQQFESIPPFKYQAQVYKNVKEMERPIHEVEQDDNFGL